ncbi:hypothetical protein A7M48_21040 [Acinetobacter baumannii]|nr:hypothetical protein A7M48_21040 [Acinetobacter baumannii]
MKINKLIKSDPRGINKRNGFGWKSGKSNGSSVSLSGFPCTACPGRSGMTGPEKPTHVDSPPFKKKSTRRVQLQELEVIASLHTNLSMEQKISLAPTVVWAVHRKYAAK